MILKTWAGVDCNTSVESMWQVATDSTRFPAFFTGFGLRPAVLRVEVLGNEGVKKGTRRKIYNQDGSVITEIVDRFEINSLHSYRLVEGFKPPFSWLVREGRATWEFQRNGSNCGVVWRYEFELTTFLFAWIVGPILWIFFKRAMRDCLQKIHEAALSIQ